MSESPPQRVPAASAETVPLAFRRLPVDAMRERARAFYERMRTRRTVRDFSTGPIPLEVIDLAIRAAGTAPSGAHLQPWHFAVVTCPDLKRRIREAAETEERANYDHRFPEEWLDALAALGTDADKPHLEEAPALIVVFAEKYREDADGAKHKNYYVMESVGIATGMLLAALHDAGLATLTHTPNPMGFLRDLLGRPRGEMPVVIIPVGYPAEGCEVPALERKRLDAIRTWHGPKAAPRASGGG